MKNKKFLFIIIIAFFLGIGTNMGHPITPYYISQINLPSYVFGYFFSAMSLGMLLFAPIWGSYGDTRSRKKIILICCVFYSVGQVLFGTFHHLYIIIFARFFSGIFSSGINVSLLAYATNSKGLQNVVKSKRLATIIALQVAGGAIGNYIGGEIGMHFSSDYGNVLYIQAIFLSIVGVLIYLLLNDKDEEKNLMVRKNALSSLKDIKKLTPWYFTFLSLLALISLVFTVVTRYLDVFFKDNGFTSGDLGQLNLMIGITTIIANIFITNRLISKLGSLKTPIITIFIGAIMIYLTFHSPAKYLIIALYSFYLIYVACKAIFEPATINFISDNKSINSGVLLGVRQSFISLGSVIGPLIAGYIYVLDQGKILFDICAILLMISGTLMILLYKRKGALS